MSPQVPAPELAFQSILRSHWDPSETGYDGVPVINTGEYRRNDTPVPLISITGGSEGPVLAGPETGYTAIDGSGRGGIQRISGAVTIDCVAGSYDDLVGAGPNGEDLNPKQLRWEMYAHATQLLVNYQDDTAFTSIAPGDGDKIEAAEDQDDGVTYTFSIQFRARYTYERRPEDTSA